MMRYFKTLSKLALLILMSGLNNMNAQELNQTIRGTVKDQDSKTTLPGANVIIIMGSEIGVSTDLNGEFRIENVPVGRHSLKVSYLGYEEKVIPNILLSSGKELVLTINLQEALYKMDEVEITATKDKSKIDNEMALISAREFSVEETKRYAGSFNDPARMVSGYAGTTVDAEGDNSIVVRGNSPKGIQWRLEGIEIPNPNHFSEEGATGGAINALNSKMLDNSEFYTGAFPAEYGNALSGVFDMKLRKGNNEQREYSFTVGALGIDATMEGPFQKGKGSSYLLNYRYSTLSLLDNLGFVDFGGIPEYQDMTFNVFLPTASFGTFSIFGLGGKSNIVEKRYDNENEEVLLEKYNYKAHMGVVGINQFLPLGSKSYLQNSISASQNGSGMMGNEPDLQNELFGMEEMELDKSTLKAASTLHHKFNAKHNIQTGLVYTQHFFDFYYNEYNEELGKTVTDLDAKGEAGHYQGFLSWKYRASQTLSFVSGFHAHGTDLNNKISFEPRLSMRWQFDVEQAFTAGFGIHGKMESLPNYFSIVHGEDGNPSMPNKDIGFTKARHYVLGYENKLSRNLYLKLEAYYQDIYNVPVENDPNSSYSLLNQTEGFTDRILINEGSGENMGIELTLERFFSDNYYFMTTLSLFDSKYTAMDGVERDTRFNANYVGNLLFGKEFELKSNSSNRKVLSLNTKLSLLGARRFTPIDLQASREQGRTVFNEDEAYSERADNIFIANFGISYRVDSKKISQEFKVDIQNASNNAARLYQYYDENTDKIEYGRQLSLLPVVMYTIHF